jgi:predicted esterase
MSNPAPAASGAIEHHLAVTRTARFFTQGDPTAARSVWYACHGYGQLASAFLGYVATAATDSRLLVAPEALSRFYHDDGRGPIGACWMTREDRENEIADYVRFLDAIDENLRTRLPADHRRFMLGFSQGVATVSRWIVRGNTSISGVILWAGTVAPDLDPGLLRQRLAGKRLALVAGNKDSYVSPEWFDHEAERFAAAGADCRAFAFHGGHRLDRVVLAQAMEFIETG